MEQIPPLRPAGLAAHLLLALNVYVSSLTSLRCRNYFRTSSPHLALHEHREVSYVNRPFPLSEAHEHLARLESWGFNFRQSLCSSTFCTSSDDY